MATIIVLIIGMMITGFAIFSIYRSKVIENQELDNLGMSK